MVAIRLRECKGLRGAVLVGRTVEAATFSAWQMTRLEDRPHAPATYAFLGRGEVNAYWSTEGPDVLRLENPLRAGTYWTWTGLSFVFEGDTVRCTIVGPPEEEQ